MEENRSVNESLTGTVLAVQANFYKVQLHSFPASSCSAADKPPIVLCTRRSRLKKIGQRVMVGDRVEIEEPDGQGEGGAISQVLPRQTELDRPPIANANHILLVFALADPPLDPHQLSRFLVKAESTGLAVSLALNKSDLATPEEQQQWGDRLQAWGYDPLFVSVYAGIGIDRLQQHLQQAITVVSGPSGVGKSSLIARLIPSVDLRVAAVSGKLGRGRHTTRHVELFELPGGGLLADTPGFNQPELDCTADRLIELFPEGRSRLAGGRCQFTDCLHRDEPNCVVAGEWERYEHYLMVLTEAIAHQVAIQQLGKEESSLKLRTKRSGVQQYEPKLESKKYRRQSRRKQHQSLDDFCED